MDDEAPELAEKQSAKINKHGGKRANSGGRRSGAGRKKGSPNKLTADVKAAIMAALDAVGGADYLKTVARTDPRTFCTLLGKILPTQVTGDAEAGRVRIEFSWLPPQSSGSQPPCSPRRSSQRSASAPAGAGPRNTVLSGMHSGLVLTPERPKRASA
jgi:hypothetical protein